MSKINLFQDYPISILLDNSLTPAMPKIKDFVQSCIEQADDSNSEFTLNAAALQEALWKPSLSKEELDQYKMLKARVDSLQGQLDSSKPLQETKEGQEYYQALIELDAFESSHGTQFCFSCLHYQHCDSHSLPTCNKGDTPKLIRPLALACENYASLNSPVPDPIAKDIKEYNSLKQNNDLLRQEDRKQKDIEHFNNIIDIITTSGASYAFALINTNPDFYLKIFDRLKSSAPDLVQTAFKKTILYPTIDSFINAYKIKYPNQ